MNTNSQKNIIEKLNLQMFSSRAVLNIPANLHDFKDLAFDSTIEDKNMIWCFSSFSPWRISESI